MERTGVKADYRKIMESDFYVKNSCGYCVFLQLFYSSLPNFTIKFFHPEYKNMVVKTVKEPFLSLDHAKAWTEKTLCPIYGFSSFEIVKGA